MFWLAAAWIDERELRRTFVSVGLTSVDTVFLSEFLCTAALFLLTRIRLVLNITRASAFYLLACRSVVEVLYFLRDQQISVTSILNFVNVPSLHLPNRDTYHCNLSSL